MRDKFSQPFTEYLPQLGALFLARGKPVPPYSTLWAVLVPFSCKERGRRHILLEHEAAILRQFGLAD